MAVPGGIRRAIPRKVRKVLTDRLRSGDRATFPFPA